VVQFVGASGCRQASQGTCVMAHWQGVVGIQVHKSQNGGVIPSHRVLSLPSFWTSSSVVYMPTSLDEGRGESLSGRLCRFRVHVCICILSRVLERSFPGYFAFVVAVDDGDSPVVRVSCSLSIPASTFLSLCVRPHPSIRGRARFEVGWAACTRGGCPGHRFGRFGIQGVVFAVFGIRSGLLAVDGAKRQVVGVDGVWQCVYAVFTVLVVLADLGELTGVLTKAPPFSFSRRP